MVSREILQAYRFFRRQGCGADSALNLARAEQWGRERGLQFEWLDDEDMFPPTDRAECIAEYGVYHQVTTCEMCSLSGPDGEYLEAAIGAIWDASPEYRRVIEAELANQAMESEWTGAAKSVLSL